MVAVPVTPAFIPPPIPVPGIRGAPLGLAYRVLREDGLAATIIGPFRAGTRHCQPLVATQSPGVDRTAAAGSTIRVTLVPNRCGENRPVLPARPLPRATAPDFTGAPVTRAVRWADIHGLMWATGPLATVRNADTGQLLANWRITSQSPAPGMMLALGTVSRHGSAGILTPTPLTLQAQPVRP